MNYKKFFAVLWLIIATGIIIALMISLLGIKPFVMMFGAFAFVILSYISISYLVDNP
jgi:hypothetical protein